MTLFLTVDDYKKEASKKLTRLARDYYNGASEELESLNRNENAYKRLLIRPRCLRDVSKVDMSTSWLGSKQNFPIGIAPTAFHKMADPLGEISTCRGAARSGSLIIASSWSTTPLEEMAQEIIKNGGQIWFQLYVYKDMSTTMNMVKRAEKAGCTAIVITVDTPVLGRRLADLRNAFSLPDSLRLANFADVENKCLPSEKGGHSGLMTYVSNQIDSSLDWDTVQKIKSQTTLPILIKGVMRADDARNAVARGIDGIIISNHGGRQLDGTPATIEVLPEIVKAVKGSCPVFIDGGIRTGRDVFKAIALGANGVFVGRPIVWALAVNGEQGVHDVVKLLQDEFRHTMQLAGMASIEDMQSTKDLIVTDNYYSKL